MPAKSPFEAACECKNRIRASRTLSVDHTKCAGLRHDITLSCVSPFVEQLALQNNQMAESLWLRKFNDYSKMGDTLGSPPQGQEELSNLQMQQEDLVKSSQQIFERQEDFDTVCLVLPLGQEGPIFHRDILGFGNQVGSFVAAKCLAPTKKIIGYHRLQLVTPWSLLSKGRRLDFLRRSQLLVPKFKMSRERRGMAPPVTGDSFIDRKRRVLFLSCEFANKNPDLFSNFENLDIQSLRNDLKVHFGITFPDRANPHRSLAAHYRLGDFADPIQEEDSLKVNTRISFDIFACKFEQAIAKVRPEEITLFTDGDLRWGERELLMKVSRAQGARLQFASKWNGGRKTFDRLLEHRFILASNSTLSAWAAVLGGSRGIRMFDELPIPTKFIGNFDELEPCDLVRARITPLSPS